MKPPAMSDIISLGGVLAPDIHVSDVMNAESGLLCYKY